LERSHVTRPDKLIEMGQHIKNILVFRTCIQLSLGRRQQNLMFANPLHLFIICLYAPLHISKPWVSPVFWHVARPSKQVSLPMKILFINWSRVNLHVLPLGLLAVCLCFSSTALHTLLCKVGPPNSCAIAGEFLSSTSLKNENTARGLCYCYLDAIYLVGWLPKCAVQSL
jgi:hypothetical protein